MSTLSRPPFPQKGKPMTAESFYAWFIYFLVNIEQATVSVQEGSGLTLRQTSDGTEIGLKVPPGLHKAKVTQLISLASSDGLTLGSGKVTLYTEVWTGTAYKFQPVQSNVLVYFGAPNGGTTTTIAVNQWGVVGRMASGVYEVVTGYC